MRFYAMQPSEYDRLDPRQRHALYLHIERIKARERLEFISDIGSLLAGEERAAQDDAKRFLSGLAHTAYPFEDEDDELAVLLEAITR